MRTMLSSAPQLLPPRLRTTPWTLRVVAIAVGLASVTTAGVAVGQEDDEGCPPGGWFCEEGPEPGAEPDVVTEPPPVTGPDGGGGPSTGPEPVELPEGKEKSEPPVVVYTPEGEAPPKIVVVKREKEPGPPDESADPLGPSEWGLNLRLQGAMMGDRDRHPDAGMGGFGLSLRYRPIPQFAFDAGLDFLGGTDFQGYPRRETAFLLSGMIFFNPRDPVQVYTLGGFGISGASVDQDGEEVAYGYFGGHLGLGLEFRIAEGVALGLDVLGFVRGRTDERAELEPEFVDEATGRTTNMSGGGLFRGGLTFYW